MLHDGVRSGDAEPERIVTLDGQRHEIGHWHGTKQIARAPTRLDNHGA
jgi:hypothetical protein